MFITDLNSERHRSDVGNANIWLLDMTLKQKIIFYSAVVVTHIRTTVATYSSPVLFALIPNRFWLALPYTTVNVLCQ